MLCRHPKHNASANKNKMIAIIETIINLETYSSDKTNVLNPENVFQKIRPTLALKSTVPYNI